MEFETKVEALEMENARIKSRMTFGGIIQDPMRNPLSQSADIQDPKDDKILKLEDKVKALLIDNQFLNEQIEE